MTPEILLHPLLTGRHNIQISPNLPFDTFAHNILYMIEYCCVQTQAAFKTAQFGFDRAGMLKE